MSDDRETTAHPDPADRALPGPTRGTPAVLAGGGTWILADLGLSRLLNGPRDRLFDDMILSSAVDMADVYLAAWYLLLANYNLSGAEVEALLGGADPGPLKEAVLDALFGPEAPRRTYSAWARAALVANGLDPAEIRGDDLPHVLAMLVRAGRAVPTAEYVESAEAVAERKRIAATFD
jgi:hypothetical protein